MEQFNLKKLLEDNPQCIKRGNVANIPTMTFTSQHLDDKEKELAFTEFINAVSIKSSNSITPGLTLMSLIKRDKETSLGFSSTNHIVDVDVPLTEKVLKVFGYIK